MPPLQRTRRSAGFTLIEMIIAVTIMTILVGAAIPLTSKIVNSTARRATRSELEGLSAAVTEYFTDTGALPASISDLLVDPLVAGWTGPYLGGVTTDSISGLTTFEVDGWSRTYAISIVGDVWTCTSSGGDGTAGSADDIAVVLDVTGVRRRVTLERLPPSTAPSPATTPTGAARLLW